MAWTQVGTLALAPDPVTRRLPYSNGGLGGSVATNITAQNISQRWAVKLPVKTDRWRLKLRHYDAPAATNKTPLTGKKILFGDHARTLTGVAAETGSFVGNAATTIVGSDFTITGDATPYVSPWVTASADQFRPNTEHLLAVAATAASSISMQTGAGRAWYWNNATNGVDPTVAGSAATNQTSWVLLDWVIEYEYTDANNEPPWLIVGDSIPEGISGPRGTSGQTPTSLWRSYPWQWALHTGVPVVNISLAGISAVYFASAAAGLWTRQDTSLAGGWAGAIVPLGSNDMASDRTLSQMQTDYCNVIANARSIVGASAPIYAVNIIQRTQAANQSARDSVRNNFNDWLAQLPAGIAGCVDMDGATRGTASTAPSAAYTNDNIHLSWPGHVRAATELAAALPAA